MRVVGNQASIILDFGEDVETAMCTLLIGSRARHEEINCKLTF